MPTPTPPERQRALAALAALARSELAAVWLRLDMARPERFAQPLSQVLLALTDKYGAAAASLAADWYDEAREDAAALGRFAAIPAAAPTAGRMESLARWGVGPLFADTADPALALSRLSGGLSRTVLDQARDTTAGSTELDPARPRFARHASANACTFCLLLATRGPVYVSEESAGKAVGHAQGSRALGEKYHDFCKCTAIEVFDGTTYAEAPYVAKWRDTYNDVKVTGGEYDAIDLKATIAEMRKTLGTH